MKVVAPQQMAEIESLAYRDGASETDFMEEAGSGAALVIHDYAEKHNGDRLAILLCGKGNNAGDAYVAGIHLLHLDYEVVAVQPNLIEECSPLCRQNYERFLDEGGCHLDTLTDFPTSGIIVDGIFGTGFHGKVADPYAVLIDLANKSGLPIIAIDIPSGLNGETGIAEGGAIIAQETAFLGLPKLGFFLNEGWNHTGKLRYVDFGLDKKYFDSVPTEMLMLTSELLQPLMPKLKRNQHKYEAGYVVGVAGSPGMPGAAMLSSSAALRGGAGIVRLLHPDGMQAELAASPYELIRAPYHPTDTQEMLSHLNKAAAVFIGPGLGRTPQVRTMLGHLLPYIEKPCVLDADALYFLAEEDYILPKQTVVTPHHGEMMRLLHRTQKPVFDFEFLNTCHNWAEKKKVTLILKGAPTMILHPDAPMLVNPTGDPGMATAGSGDVLTGLVAAFLAQGCAPKDAASLSVYLHGLAGEHAAEELTSYGVCASDIFYHFPEAFRFLEL